MNPTSVDGYCGSTSKTNATCLASVFGNCCSQKGYCGASEDYCGDGCQPTHGTCTSLSMQTISTSGSCGATATLNLTCLGSAYGNCCSALGYCGGNSSYCDSGCQNIYGSCVVLAASSSVNPSATSSSSVSSTLSSAIPSATSITMNGTVSIDGNCGLSSVVQSICLGSTFGDCCSARGYCGKTVDYCDAGCQPRYGTCNLPSSTSSSSTSSTISSTPSPTTITSNSSARLSPGLTTGAKAGIAVGSTVAGLALLAVVGFIVFRILRKRDTHHQVQSTIDAPVVHHVSGLHEASEGAGRVPGPVELPATQTRQWKAMQKQRSQEEKERKERERRARVEDRAAAGYEGAYRGN